MELFRQRLLESSTKQSDLIEIFSAIDRGKQLTCSQSYYTSKMNLI